MTPKQPALPLNAVLSQESHIFYISDVNAEAVRDIREYLAAEAVTLPKRIVVLGEEKSGKTALLDMLSGHSFGSEAVSRLVSADTAYYDIAPVLSQDDETALFHMLNTDAETDVVSCIAMRRATLDALTLPDLVSRLKAAYAVTLPAPDEHMLAYLVGKALAERQLSIASGLPEYAAARLPRRYAAAFTCVEILDKAALERGCAVNVKLASQCPEAFED